MKKFALLVAAALLTEVAQAYPTDEFERTKIRRLEWQQRVDAGTARGTRTPPGAQWPSSKITLKLSEAGQNFRLSADTPKDPALQAGLEGLLKKGGWQHYHVALLDLTHPDQARYAAVHEQDMQTPGSVAKLLVGAALLQAIKDRLPNDFAAREAFLRDTWITADEWAMPNSHEVPLVENGELKAIRPVKIGDRFSLWEWADHMLSPSSNAAASIVWRETTLMSLLAADYPPKNYGPDLFARFDKATFSKAAFDAVDRPLRDAELSPETFNLRLFFTKGPARFIDGDQSRVSPLALLQWLVTLEQGRMVDAWSSLELKRLIYLTRRRIRYAKAQELSTAAVFFKSGSLFQCKPEAGFQCIQYQGNEVNVLNALVEIESPTRTYMVAVMSNELKKNAAEDHSKLASAIDRLVNLTP